MFNHHCHQVIKRMDLAEMHQDRILLTVANACAGHAGAEDGKQKRRQTDREGAHHHI
jgi:hypothetical protein